MNNVCNIFLFQNVLWFPIIQNHCGKLTVHISNKTSYIEFINSLEAAAIVNENASFKW